VVRKPIPHPIGQPCLQPHALAPEPLSPRNDEETGIRLDAHRFVENEYVSIRDEQVHSHTFTIDRIRPIEANKEKLTRAELA
jgi:hypothetical protein